MGKETKAKLDWKAHFENLEDRFMMSADPIGDLLGGSIVHHEDLGGSIVHHEDLGGAIVHHEDLGGSIFHHEEPLPDFWIAETDEERLNQELWEIEQALANAHNQSGQSQVVADYGFDGGGQTVAIIDSGIAYDHYALGGGFGEGYRVVGGWDFSGENDADPYDDGPSGSHGTHVAGIVGADQGTHQGVATGVDLVGLRVFDDAGAGYFSWVEDALQWVHDNQHSFDNPITTVNLSLGVSSWNSSTTPSWAMLEDEFAQLEADGIFIAVSAGNAFNDPYTNPGLSYPAASPYVVPVMSVNDNGSLSGFSQRHERAIAAPGAGIVSTIPDWKGNNNGDLTDDWGGKSGTSMASPYVAGASVLVREAMEFVGYANITQDMIYDHIVDTADSVWDDTTGAWYNRLNLEAAIDALMPTDDFGSTLASAFSLGTITDTDSISGLIGTLDDSDYFTFTSGVTGSVTFTASSMTHDLQAAWQLDGGGGEVSGAANETFTFDVVSGQDYTLSFSSTDGLGYYDFDITSEESFSFIDLGAISFNQFDGTSSVDEQWYRIESTTAGYVSVESFFETSGGQINLHLFDANMQEIDAGNGVAGAARVDAYAAAGEAFYVCVLGTNADIDLRMSNLVSLDGTTVSVSGTDGDDTFSFTAGSTTHSVSVNDVTYDFASNSITNVDFEGGNGNDTITMTGTAGDETATIHVGNATLAGAGFAANAIDVENVNVHGGGGFDLSLLYDTNGDDVYTAGPNSAVMTGAGYSHSVVDFDSVYAFSSGGTDVAHLEDSSGNDSFKAYPAWARMAGSGFYNYVGDFEQVYAYSTNGGTDQAYLYDSPENDAYRAYATWARLAGTDFYNYAGSFEEVYAYSSLGGTDTAYLYDSAGNDSYKAYPTWARFAGTGFYNAVTSFDAVYAFSTVGGYDTAALYDSSGNDSYKAAPTWARLAGSGFYNYAGNFEQVDAFATAGGYDQAFLYDSSGNEYLYSYSNGARLLGNGFSNSAFGFSQTSAYSTQGYDQAHVDLLQESESLYGYGSLISLNRTQGGQTASGFDGVLAEFQDEWSINIDEDTIDFIFEMVEESA